MNLIIHAPNVHQGGGRTLLLSLLQALDATTQTKVVLDTRMPVPVALEKVTTVLRVRPTLPGRFLAEWRIRREVAPGDVVICFGNLPPLFRLHGRVVVFIQNRYLLDDVDLSGLPFRVRLRIRLERLWLSRAAAHAGLFVVQTPSMQQLLQARLQTRVPVMVLPFAETMQEQPVTDAEPRPARYDFIYVASGEPHKNHRRLVEAWVVLAQEGLFPRLCLTVQMQKHSALCRWIEETTHRHGLHIDNHDLVGDERVKDLYRSARALIYPSLFESFGLPLIEAVRAGLPLLTAERDYVRDVAIPVQTFDPDSPVSIARAVKRFLGVDEAPLSLVDASHFIRQVLREA